MIYEIIIGILIYAVLFVVTVQSSRRKVLALQERIDKVHALQELQQAQSQQSISRNEARIRELETLLQKLGDENSLLRLELEEKKETLYYNNKVAMIENEKRQQAETVIFSSAPAGRDCYLLVGRLSPDTGKPECGTQSAASRMGRIGRGSQQRLFRIHREAVQSVSDDRTGLSR